MLCSLVLNYLFYHSRINFESLHYCVTSFIYLGSKINDIVMQMSISHLLPKCFTLRSLKINVSKLTYWTDQAVSLIRPWTWLLVIKGTHVRLNHLFVYFFNIFFLYPGHCIQGQTELLQLRWAFILVANKPCPLLWLSRTSAMTINLFLAW